VLKDGEVMSKSRGNIVDPDEVIARFGADTLRLFILFAAPPEDQLEWNPAGLEGSWKFINRLWGAVESRYKTASPVSDGPMDALDKALEFERHAAVKKVTESMEGGFKFNTAISGVMILMNAVDRYQVPAGDMRRQALLNDALETAVLLLAPFIPHAAEELWQMMGKPGASIAFIPWPVYSDDRLRTDTVRMAAQVNGKVRGEFEVPRDADEAFLRPLVLADEGVQRHVAGKEIRKFIVIKNKLVSIVV